ncbi:unnamed protein product [Ceutorhynchus assimilis]|uniref:Uncharacterized protein n=1 Tax=Ceutorhynchus assimilis TaxID=467358 RepID=A0A9N9QI66_9CUCU|nr:unnamed protein product [Ceutorhynchus assimilis]
MAQYKHFLETLEARESLNTEEEIELDQEVEEQETAESVDELRERLENMKKLMADRNQNNDNKAQRRKPATDVIDGNFLSIMFALTLFVILVVSIYAFYNLFWAIWKRNSRYHEEL